MTTPDFYGVGSEQERCRVCKGAFTDHQIKGIAITEATVEAAGKILASTLAMRSPSGGNTKQERRGDVEDFANRMVGALVAVTSSGHEIQLVASSGHEMTPAVHGWITADVDVPRTADGAWVNIYGNDIKLTGVPDDHARKGCAAIKLLLKLGRLFKEQAAVYKGFKSIAMYESPATVEVFKTDARGRIRGRWDKGKATLDTTSRNIVESYCGIDPQYTDAAASCPSCQMRIPSMLCSRAR